ncbi:hypothetical protein C8J56DRAFT_965348 [Mycena floridula]|nr:hypothetical protein C8J56DRAFT_965348 [Mycena floridula]
MGEWIDEDEEEDEEDLLELEFHPSYVNNVEKRRRRWETKWDSLLQSFQALDRQTDATLVLMAAPSHSSKLHLVASRSIRRQPALARSPLISSLRMGFRQIAIQRRNIRSMKSSLADRLLMPQNGSPGEGSIGSTETREEDLKRALNTALGSLGAMGRIYEEREARWREETRRINDDRQRIELLLGQALGDRITSPIEGSASSVKTP